MFNMKSKEFVDEIKKLGFHGNNICYTNLFFDLFVDIEVDDKDWDNIIMVTLQLRNNEKGFIFHETENFHKIIENINNIIDKEIRISVLESHLERFQSLRDLRGKSEYFFIDFLTEIYPDLNLKRNCVLCEKSITIIEFIKSNYKKEKGIIDRLLIKIWNSEFLSLPCCNCFRILKENLKSKEDICRFFEKMHVFANFHVNKIIENLKKYKLIEN
ncbi:unnamed protein product [marine sediment metagenome]|uniref:Uncharacterized protein n=1 Tax=marine sediment metagenome TaxID=412755 RepID=X1C3T3_9ZZZZ